jgi:hypothetical protein
MRSRTVARLAATTIVLGAAAVVVATPTSASALSCVMPDQIVKSAEHVFSGRIIDSEGNRILMAVDSQEPGEPVPAEVWLTVDLAGWIVWDAHRPIDSGSGVPQAYSSPRRWLVAADDEWQVNACTMWWASEPYVGDIDAQVVTPVVPPEGEEPEADAADPGEGRDPAPSVETGPAAHEDGTLAAAAAGGVGLGAVLTAGGLWWRRHPAGRDAGR